MKILHLKLWVVLIVLSVTINTIAQPLFVGHRGSYWGVENTAEAFINGALKGYQYLECDIKVAGDGTIVLTHDDTTDRLGGSLSISNSTIDQLKAETYTQTRGGITYTGKICTLAEYLDICAEYKVLPVIELKWATGINSNDQSGMPALVKLIEDKGFRNKCIILTSMKPCLEYLRKNYPDITLQFLTNSNWANHFDWCVEWRMDVDIQATGFNKETVQKFHDAGLKVNVWTVNDNANYKAYTLMGCDFITTDYLDLTKLPTIEIDPEPEPIDLALETLWENSLNKSNAPTNINGTYAQQGAAYQGHFYVNDCNKKMLFIFNQHGCIDSVAGGSGYGTASDDAGNIIVRNDKQTDGNHQFLIYDANDIKASPLAINTTNPITGQTNFISTSGNLLTDTGYIYMFPKDKKQANIIEVVQGSVTKVTASAELNLTGTAAGYIIPMNNDPQTWLYHVRSSGFYRHKNGESTQFYTARSGTKAPMRNTTGGGDAFVMYNNKILLHNSGENYKGGFTVRNLSTEEALFSINPIGTMGYEDGGNYSTFNWLFAELRPDSSYYIYQYCPSNGMAMYHLYDRNRHSSTSTSINTTSTDNSTIHLYPNPANDYIHIDRDTAHQVNIYNIMGKLIVNTTSNHINISHLSPGIYFLTTENQTLKFIKQ